MTESAITQIPSPWKEFVELHYKREERKPMYGLLIAAITLIDVSLFMYNKYM